MDWVKIGGYGEIGDTNWGFDYSRVDAQKWFDECSKHIGETVLLTGGGSPVGSWRAQLKEVTMSELGGKQVPKVFLARLEPPTIGDGVEFEPWLGSWQLSVKKRR